ncbi:MAG: serine/threonine-protein kinase, partial [Trebonia sp.]
MRDLPFAGDEFAGYRLLAVLGRGGMSTVYEAESPRLGHVIALKVIAAELAGDDVFRARFLEESRIAGGLNHPNVVPIHDSGSSDGLLYIAMRCVNGTDLRQMLKKRGRLPAERAVFLLGQAARALDAAHRHGLVHRDVKPGNLLVERGNDETDPDHLYLTDFGIAKHAAERTGLTASGQFIGTLDYISPEQIRGLPVLGMADQYSLGCVLYECLTGRVPFERDMDAAIIWAHVEERPTEPTLLRPDLPPAVDEVFARVLAKQPGDRYASCREFMAAARQALGAQAEPPEANRRSSGGLPRARLAPFPAEPQSWHADPAELAHESAAVYGEATDAVPGLASWAGSDSPPPGHPPGVGRERSRRRGPRRTAGRTALYVAIVLALAAGVGLTLAEMTGSGTSTLALSGNGTTATPSVNVSVSAPARASTSPSASSSMNMGVQAGNGESGPDTLAGVLGAANSSVEGRGLLPAAKCGNYQQNAAGQIVCVAPVPGVA